MCDDDAIHADTRPGGRLRNGELRRQVAGFLADHAGSEFTPGEVARGLPGGRRSSGAVANALALLADRGEAERTSTRPVRYRATATTTTAAASALSAPSGSPSPARPPRTTAAPSAPSATPVTSVPSGSVGTAAAVVVSGPVTRPNGQLYHPRQLSGLPDVTALRRLRQAGVAALLYGPPGTGKTSVVEAAFPDLVTVQGDGDTTVADLVGEYTQTPDGRYVFVFSELINDLRGGASS